MVTLSGNDGEEESLKSWFLNIRVKIFIAHAPRIDINLRVSPEMIFDK
jgi:hypothetical protein